MTREVLASRLGISDATLWRIEKEQSSPSVELVTKLQELGFDGLYLVTGSPTDSLCSVADDESWGEAVFAVQKVLEHHQLKPSPSTFWRMVRLIHAKVVTEADMAADVTGAIEASAKLAAAKSSD